MKYVWRAYRGHFHWLKILYLFLMLAYYSLLFFFRLLFRWVEFGIQHCFWRRRHCFVFHCLFFGILLQFAGHFGCSEGWCDNHRGGGLLISFLAIGKIGDEHVRCDYLAQVTISNTTKVNPLAHSLCGICFLFLGKRDRCRPHNITFVWLFDQLLLNSITARLLLMCFQRNHYSLSILF